jgi:hypothetical protein
MADAFVYPPGTKTSLVVFVTRDSDSSTVAAFTETGNPYDGSLRVPTSRSGNGILCTGRGVTCVPATGGALQHNTAVNSLSGSPPPQLPSQ